MSRRAITRWRESREVVAPGSAEPEELSPSVAASETCREAAMVSRTTYISELNGLGPA
ncbi:MAG: hypothetical protein MI923_09670 [Phycisphaerales bacterium]|nr:hypothetical protein [Phycisphaerales bacterium]